FVFGNKSTNSPTSGNGALSQHIEGLGQDHVTLVEYGDYECPYCGSYFPIVNQIAAQYNNQITFQFRNFPLTSIHPNAFAGARAAEAAALQGKFWQMHDLLYQQNEIYYANNQPQNNWVGAPNPQTYFDQLATQLGLNLTKFNQDYTSNLVNGTINADMAEGNKLGVSGTPAFFLDGKQISVGESAAQFQSIINTEIAKKTGKATTTSPTSAGSTAQTHK
ncbi:MAG TPA: DsbA family protein, partial [Candidatus Dormibacteraeota bacterium]|nr:DsbA family protein [Candidatus Dormibacteraeota bacterium]